VDRERTIVFLGTFDIPLQRACAGTGMPSAAWGRHAPMMKRLVHSFVAAALFVLVASPSARAEHPFLAVRASEYARLQALSAGSPWKELKAAAITEATTLAYDTSLPAGTERAKRARDIIDAAALAYLVDAPGRPTYLSRIKASIGYVEDVVGDDPGGWGGCVPPSMATFHLIIALDIIHDALSPKDLSDSEKRVGALVSTLLTRAGDTWVLSNRSLSAIWALYRGDSAQIATRVSDYRTGLLDSISPDGVDYDGTGYADARFAGDDRDHKHLFMDVLEHVGGQGSYYGEPKLQRFHEWLFGYAYTPWRGGYAFGDSLADGASRHGDPPAAMRAYRFGDASGRYATWFSDGGPPTPHLFTYLLYRQGTPLMKERPSSRIFPDGGAWLQEPGDRTTSLVGALWNVKKTAGHAHLDVNSVQLSGYGENLLRNVGYRGYGKDYDATFTWEYIHKSAKSANTVLVDGIDHVAKEGAGIQEGLTTSPLDYASGDSGAALSNGTHIRNMVFVHADRRNPGYFVLFDEIISSTGASADLLFRANSNECTARTPDVEFDCPVTKGAFTQNEVSLALLLATKPSAVAIEPGAMASFASAQRFIADVVRATVPLVPEAGTAKGRGARMVSIFFPYDAGHPRARMNRLAVDEASGGAVDLGHSALDTALESAGNAIVESDGAAFQGRAALWRKTRDGLEFAFVRQGLQFLYGASRVGFKSSAPATVVIQGPRTWVTGKGTSLTLYYPKIVGATLDGSPTAGAPRDGAITVTIPAGSHEVVLQVEPPPSPPSSPDGLTQEVPGGKLEEERQPDGAGCACRAASGGERHPSMGFFTLGSLLALLLRWRSRIGGR
jgi:hypothetical protein